MGHVLGRALLLAAGLGGASLPEPSGGADAYLAKVGFSPSEIAEVRAGSIVARALPQKDDNSAFVVGVAHIGATEDAFVERMRTIDTFRAGGRVLQSGRFATPPSAEDLQALVFESQDIEQLRKCRIGDCDVKADTRTIALAGKVDWSAPDSKAQASRMMKEALVAQANDYCERGTAAMPVYVDNEVPESAATEFAKLLESTPRLLDENPAFYQYLLDFPRAPLPNVENFVYWSKEKVRRPVVSLVHVCLQRVEIGGEQSYFIALKHIYDSHYFLAYAEFLALIPCAGAPNGFDLIHAVRARIDPPRWLRGLLLGKVKREMRIALIEDLKRTKTRLEAVASN
jgi:hypothetical protein